MCYAVHVFSVTCRIIHSIRKFQMDLDFVTLLRTFRQIAQIEHFSYAYFRVLFLACDGRRRGDPNGSAPKTYLYRYLENGTEKFLNCR